MRQIVFDISLFISVKNIHRRDARLRSASYDPTGKERSVYFSAILCEICASSAAPQIRDASTGGEFKSE
jgi:hypothetical protein